MLFYSCTLFSSLNLLCKLFSFYLSTFRLEERGKKYRKNWSSCNLVLTDKMLVFYKDTKSFTKPDQHLDLTGARIEWCNSDKSKRLNVFEISTVLEQKILLQECIKYLLNIYFFNLRQIKKFIKTT